MGNTFTACAGRRMKPVVKQPIADPSPMFVEKKPPSSPKEKPFFEYGSMRRFTRQDSTNRGPIRNAATSTFSVNDSYFQNPLGTSRGYAIILAMTDFEEELKQRHSQLKDRQGVLKDTSDLSTVLDQAGYDVQVLWNPTADLARKTLKTAVRSDKISTSDSFVCVCLTVSISNSAETDECLAFFDTCLSVRKLTNPLWKAGSEAVTGLPKIFLIEAVSSQSLVTDMADSSVISTLLRKGKRVVSERKFPPEEPDFLVVQSSSPKLVLSQDPRLGSYFVQKLIGVLRFNAVQTGRDALSILTLLGENLRLANSSISFGDEERNGIVIASSLRKDFRFFREDTVVSK